jgi:hypothetical protein
MSIECTLPISGAS